MIGAPGCATRDGSLRADLRRIKVDGVFYSVMVGTGETFLAVFVLALGMGEVTAGLIASIPMLAGAIMQLLSPIGVRLMRSHRRWVTLAVAVQAATFVPLIIGAAVGSMPVWLLFVAASLYWGAGMAAGGAWTTWVTTLVPARVRPRFFATRTRAMHIAVLLGILGAGTLLELVRSPGRPAMPYVAVFLVACACRGISARLLLGQREPRAPDASHRHVPMHHWFGRLRHGPDGRLLAFMLAMQFSVNLSGPYFTPFMRGELGMSYWQFVMLLATSYSARVLLLPRLGDLVHRIGERRVLRVAGVLMIPLSALWIVSDNLAWLFVVQLAAGAIWAAYELATFLLQLEIIPEEERTSVLTTYNACNAVALVSAAALGGWLLHVMHADHSAYMVLFGLSGVLRLLCVPLLIRAVRPVQRIEGVDVPLILPPLDARTALQAGLTHTVAVRPNRGAMEAQEVTGPVH